MWPIVCKLSKFVTYSRKATHLKYGVNTTLCREDEFEITQSQTVNVASISNGVVLYSDEGKRLIVFISSNSVINVFIIFLLYSDYIQWHRRPLSIIGLSFLLAEILLEKHSTILKTSSLCFWSCYTSYLSVKIPFPSFCVWANDAKEECFLWCSL